jgi:nicotinamide-nucleotide amidase
VSSRVIEAEGAVSEAVVRAMAAAARERAGADLAVAVSGVAGPGGGTPAKPVGLVWFAWAPALGLEAESRHFDGDRDAVRRQSVAHALRGLITLAGRGVSGSGSQDDAGGTSASRPPRSGGDVST